MVTSLVSASWATPDDIPPGVTEPPGGWEGLLADASDILFELSGRQWRGSGQSRVQVLPAHRTERPLLPGWVPLPAVLGRSVYGIGRGGFELVKLPSSPVISVDEVTIGDVVLAADEYACDTAGLLERTDCRPWPCDGSLFVTFTHGITPPEGGKRGAASLAVELAKARAGDSSCRLRNFQTITREGITVAVNLRDALIAGMTGLYEVDLWLKSVNPHGFRRRGGAWTPDTGRARRVSGPSILPPTPAPSYVPIVDLAIYEGDDRAFTFPVLDADGQPMPLSGYSARAQVRDKPAKAGGVLLHEWSTAAGNAVVGSGAVTLQVSDSETWSFTEGVYDLQLVDAQGNHQVIARGRVKVTYGVTA